MKGRIKTVKKKEEGGSKQRQCGLQKISKPVCYPWEEEGVKGDGGGCGGQMVMEGDLTWGGEHTVQCTGDVLQNCAPDTCIIL